MSDPYVGEIRVFGGNFAPLGWMFCDGAVLPISDYDTLFNLIGTTYGGDGQETFNLPDLRGRAPMHQGTGGGSSYVIGAMAGVNEVTLTSQQIPQHSHTVGSAAQSGTVSSPSGAVYAQPTSGIKPYRITTPGSAMATTIAAAGGSQPHDNMQPYVGVNYIISLFGIYPTQ